MIRRSLAAASAAGDHASTMVFSPVVALPRATIPSRPASSSATTPAESTELLPHAFAARR